jgi:acyl transferase domain-containing protein
VVESLNSLSVDIARAIDHEASVELWRRYQRGERDVFTRKLYTLKGQQTFDNIREKYAREPEFRTAVDRYIADFEKLLADVTRNDRDNMMTQTYLTSDTGKVYTMLAHAAGRFS